MLPRGTMCQVALSARWHERLTFSTYVLDRFLTVSHWGRPTSCSMWWFFRKLRTEEALNPRTPTGPQDQMEAQTGT